MMDLVFSPFKSTLTPSLYNACSYSARFQFPAAIKTAPPDQAAMTASLNRSQNVKVSYKTEKEGHKNEKEDQKSKKEGHKHEKVSYK